MSTVLEDEVQDADQADNEFEPETEEIAESNVDSVENLMAEIEAAEDKVAECERVVLDLKEQSKAAKAKYEAAVHRLRDLARARRNDEDRPLLNMDNAESGDWREQPLSDLFDGQILKSLTEGDLKTVGDLADYTGDDKRLTDLPNIGPGKAEKIEERMVQFWAENPEAGTDSEEEDDDES